MVHRYGRGGERGTARPEVLQSLLATTQRVVQQIDSVEYGLTDIQARTHSKLLLSTRACSLSLTSRNCTQSPVR